MRLFVPIVLALSVAVSAPALGATHKPVPRPAHLEKPVKKPVKKKAAPIKALAPARTVDPHAVQPVEKQAADAASKPEKEDAALPPPAEDLDEGQPLPPYPPGARRAMGKTETWIADEQDTLLDIARHFDLGYVEMRSANPDLDAWALLPGTPVVIPAFRILPRARQEGIVVNLAEMRLYYFKTPGAEPETMPIGIGRDGLMTPTGETEIVRKLDGPTWYPTPRMRAEHSYLPEAVPPGPMNPLGTHALYLGWPEFRIHGSNKPWAIGRRVSSGCMRLYPEDIVKLFNEVPVGTKVTVVEQPLLLAWVGRKLYLEANPSRQQSNQLEIDGAFAPKELTPAVKNVIGRIAGATGLKVLDWDAAAKALLDRSGMPVLIADLDAKPAPPKPEAARRQDAPHYN